MDVALHAKLVFTLSVDCAPAMEIGRTNTGHLFAIPITGGRFSGDGLGAGIRGIVLPGGADYNTRLGEDTPAVVDASHICANYIIQTDDGVAITVRNEGWKDWTPGCATTIVTTPRFQTDKGIYGWLNYGVYVGTLSPRQDKSGVELQVYRME